MMTLKELKNALLQEAVQGKLVPQIASEGNAKDLLEEIRKEKVKLVKEGKIKKEKLLPEISEDEIPFDIPENWCWCRLGEIFETTSGTTPQSKNPIYYNNGTIGWVRTTDLNNGILSFSEIKITEKAKTDCNLKMIPKNSVCIALYGGAGTIGKNAILNFETTINQSVCAMLPNTFADMRYLQYFLQWQRPYWMNYASGSRKDPNINQIIVKNCPFPLPPLAEQKRIVAAIEKFMPLIEEYGKKETELKAFNEQIGALTKKAILHEAVQGKLVPQIAAEGNAKDLLEEIKKEKAKVAGKASSMSFANKTRAKEFPPITDDEIPFDIPENWCWCKIEDITIPIGNKNNQIQSKEVLKDGKIPVVSQGQNLIDGYSNETEKTVIDIPVIMFGDHTRNVKFIDFPFVIGADGTKFFKPILCNVHYIYYLITLISLKLRNRGYARHYSLLKEEWLPLPPLAEQKRIVDVIEKMLPLCENLGK